jgi:hypothetical protein
MKVLLRTTLRRINNVTSIVNFSASTGVIMLLEDGVTYETAEADGVSVYSINVEILEPITDEAV